MYQELLNFRQLAAEVRKRYIFTDLYVFVPLPKDTMLQ